MPIIEEIEFLVMNLNNLYCCTIRSFLFRSRYHNR